MYWFPPDDPQERVEHALSVARALTSLGLVVATVGLIAIVVTVVLALVGVVGWDDAGITAFGILAATVLSGVAAYGSGTNVGLSAVRLQEALRK